MVISTFAINMRTFDFQSILKQIDLKLLKNHIEVLTHLPNENEPSRFTGTPGFYKAADYIKAQLAEYGYSTNDEQFSLTVPLDEGAEILVLGKNGDIFRAIKAHPLIPNTVNPSITPKEGIEANLIYGGTSQLSELAGKEVNGSIVLLDYNCKWYWKNAAMLGAKAIIFIEPQDTTQVETIGKSLGIPAPMPRVYVQREDGLWLKDLVTRSNESFKVILRSHMRWANVAVSNIIATKEGTQLPTEFIVVATHYDSYSVVPSIAPGATEAINVATVLELARLFSDPIFAPKRSVMFAFLAGHGQALSGAREFVDRHFYEIGSTIQIFIGIDLSYDSPYLGIYAKGSVYQYQTSVEGRRFPWVNDKIINDYVPSISEQMGKSYNVLSAMFPVEPVSDPNPMFFDADPYTLAGGIGLTFHTTNALRSRERTPLDKPEFIDYERLQPQIEVVIGSVYGFSQEPSLLVTSSPERIAADGGFATIEGYVGLYNFTTAWYDPFKNEDSIIHVQWPLAYQPSQVQFAGEGVREPLTFDIFIKPDSEGKFIVKGVKPYTAVRVEAYVIDSNSSQVLYATDFGVYGLGKGYPTPPPTAQSPGGAYFWITDELTFLWLPVFPCSSIVLYGLVDPRTATVTSISISNYNFYAHSWNLRHAEDVKGSEAMLFIPAENPSEFIINLGATATPLAVLANLTKEHPEGFGYMVPLGKTLTLYQTPYIIAQQLICLIGSRADLMASFNVMSDQVKMFYPKAKEQLKIAENALQSKEWDVAIASATAAWAYSIEAYRATMSLVMDVIITVVFFFLLMIPFSLLLQKLLVPAISGLKRTIGFVLILLASIGILGAFHPGFHIAFNAFMTMIAGGVAVLSFLALFLLLGGASEATKVQQVKALGLHYAESARAATTALAFSTGIENMRKHKLRTGLTLISLVILTTSLIVLTSASFFTTILSTQYSGKTLYNGILVREAEWNPISEDMARILEALHKGEAKVSERTWIVQSMGFRLKGDVFADGVLGLTPQEDEFVGLSQSLIEGRWFLPTDENAVIISNTLQKLLNAKIGDKINWLGLDLSIIGIYDAETWKQIVDLDQSYFAPITWEGGYPHPLPIDKLLIVPYSLLIRQFNYYPFTIGIKFENQAKVLESAFKLALQMQRIGIYAGVNEKITFYNPMTLYGVVGIQFLVLPFIISALTVLNVMLASVYERIREIHIFSSVGISPRGITVMFLAESILFGIVSSLSGYLISIAIIAALRAMSLNPTGLSVNYASTFVILAISVTTITAVISTLFPALKASSLVTPSLKRKWEVETLPRGDKWTVPLPFVLDAKEAGGALVYLGEYASASTATYGAFAVDASSIAYETGKDFLALKFNVRLAPFDLNLSQKVEVSAAGDAQRMRFALHIERISGHREQWILTNYKFIDAIRKQLLLWRSLKPDNRKQYVSKADNLLPYYKE
jgi:ABC-type antimicrobial peptide transport system permease subunit